MVLWRPHEKVAETAMRVLRNVRDRTPYWADGPYDRHPAGYLAGDLAYFPNSRIEKLQIPARALGYEPVFDYRSDQLGQKGSHEGMVQVEGGLYCPKVPEPYRDATVEYRNGTIDLDEYRRRVTARKAWRMRRKERPDADGYTRVYCPAVGDPDDPSKPTPWVKCPLREGSTRLDEFRGKVYDPPARPGLCCTQDSVTVPVEITAKYGQELHFGSDRWHAVYTTLRQTIEGINGMGKDTAKEALGQPQRRRLRGLAAQSLLVAALVFALNVRKVDAWLDRRDHEPVRQRRRGPGRPRRAVRASRFRARRVSYRDDSGDWPSWLRDDGDGPPPGEGEAA